ncbi:hypothetical protein HY630_03465 [Candidatus Uhrbacteria bacterium]|nr:hypothetical protein [Candidatus Uhrbacteria bacterium]
MFRGSLQQRLLEFLPQEPLVAFPVFLAEFLEEEARLEAVLLVGVLLALVLVPLEGVRQELVQVQALVLVLLVVARLVLLLVATLRREFPVSFPA